MFSAKEIWPCLVPWATERRVMHACWCVIENALASLLPLLQASLPSLIYADMRTESARALVKMDQELTTIVKKLAELYPHNRHLKSDFSMVCCNR